MAETTKHLASNPNEWWAGNDAARCRREGQGANPYRDGDPNKRAAWAEGNKDAWNWVAHLRGLGIKA